MFLSPKTSADGLVFHYDTGNTVRSYLGEPTVNLLYSAGAYNLIDGATDIYGRCTKTDLGNGKYRFVNNGTGVSTVRVYTNQGDLINGATYACSVYYENLVGGIGIDWCDTGIIGLNYSTNVSGRLGGYGTRGTYDGPYYFLDINFDSGGAVTLYNPQVEYKSHVTPFVAGTRSATQGLRDLTGNSIIDLTNVSFDANAQMTFDGTDDTISVNSYSAIELADNVSIEYVYMRLSTDPILDVIANKYHSTGWELFCQTGNTFALAGRNGDGTYYATSNAAYTIQNNKYYHLVANKEGLSWRLYVNGGLYASLTANSLGTWSNNGILQIGGEGGGYFPNMKLPVFKIYNRALPASEIQQNFNAIKGRYGL